MKANSRRFLHKQNRARRIRSVTRRWSNGYDGYRTIPPVYCERNSAMKASNARPKDKGDEMTAIGKHKLRWLMLVLTLLTGSQALADVTASLDRDQAAIGDTLQLTISADGDENINNIDLRPLLKDFEILRRSTSSSTRIINGQTTRTREVTLDIKARREGTLRIPPLQIGNSRSNMLLVAIGPAVSLDPGAQSVLFEAEIDRSQVYVQGQVLLTLRIQQAINLDARSVTELKLDNAFVKQLEQKSFQRNIDGRPWLVHEIRYAIFPEQSGTLEIPAQTFSARESRPRRSLFDVGSNGKQLQLNSDALTINVLPRPDDYPTGDWLPAQRLTIEETWSTPPEQLKAGESATRTIRISGEGLQGAQLPPILFPSTEGLKYYPDQPIISDNEVGTGLLGSRQDSAALVPTRAGDWEIPEVRIPWWDTSAETVRYAVLPARQITVATAPSSAPEPSPVDQPTNTAESAEVTHSGAGNLIWQIIAGICAAGWLLTALLLRRPRSGGREEAHENKDHPGESQAFKQLLAACASGSANHARSAFINWSAQAIPERAVISIDDVRAAIDDAELHSALAELDAALYRDGDSNWQGESLAAIAKRLRKQLGQQGRKPAEPLNLYPAT